MVKDLVLQFQEWSGLDAEQVKYIASLTAIISGIAGIFGVWFGRWWGWRAARREMRQFKHREDDESIVIERLILIPEEGGVTLLDRETREGVHRLQDVLGSEELCRLVRAQIQKGTSDERIFPPGQFHRLLMERVDAFITGNNEAASMAAMFGRSDEYHVDEVAFTVRYIVGEDGFKMLHVIIFDPKKSMLMNDRAFLKFLRPRRQSYAKRYLHLLPQLANDVVKSQRIFLLAEDEDKAGEEATVWTTSIRTQKLAH